MGLAFPAVATEVVPITVTLMDLAGDPVTNLFPQAKIYDRTPANAVPIDTIDLAHKADGVYQGEWTVTAASKFIVVYTVFEDVGRTIRSVEYDRDQDMIVADASGAPTPILSAKTLNPARIP